MITKTDIKDLTSQLLDCREKLLWLISQNPINDEQRKCIEHSKDLLIQVNQALEDFDVELPI
jgi:hypothetical protein